MIGALLSGALAAAPLFEQAQRPLAHVIAPPGISLSATACAECHAEPYAQWRTSRHAQAFTNALFATSYRREPDAWCLNCHAPLPEQAGSPLAEEGITCATCHVRDGAVLTSRAPTEAGESAHPMRLEAELGSSTFCANCHQFDFPLHRRPPPDAGVVVVYSGEPMQDTFGEWQRAAPATSCQGCHLPPAPGGVDHHFRGGHDDARLAAAVVPTIRWDGSAVEVTLRTLRVGHSLPTGDPFRCLRVELCLDPGCDQVVAEAEFKRTFLMGSQSWVLAEDTTIPPGDAGRTQRVELDAQLGRPRYWRLSYAFPAATFESRLSGEDREVEVARGEISR